MSQKNIRVDMIQRQDTKDNWNIKNPILLSGQIGVEIDTTFIKVGDGVKHWRELNYCGSLIIDTNSNSNYSIWIGTQDEYNNFTDRPSNLIYIIK